MVEKVAKEWRGGITEDVKWWANGKAKAFQVKILLSVFVERDNFAVDVSGAECVGVPAVGSDVESSLCLDFY